MRAISGHIWDLWTLGGPFIGADGKPHTRVTVEIGWELGEYNSAVGTFTKAPLRWVQRADNSQVETEIPNVQSVNIERSIDQDAATVSITLMNQKHNALNVSNINVEEFGNPGYLTFSRGDSSASLTLWGHVPNEWSDVLVPNALIRVYQGFGGHSKTLAECLEDGNLIQTGIFLLDEVTPATGGKLELKGRDLAKLLIDQPLYPPLVPMYDTRGCDVYPLHYARYFYLTGTQTETILYGAGGEAGDTGRSIRGIEYATSVSPCRPEMEGYWLPGDDGGVFSYGYVHFHGSLSGLSLNSPVVGMAATATNNGYWVATQDGGVFAYGDAQFYGSLPSLGVGVNNIMAIERSKDGNGYFLAGSDGGVFAFGDAVYDGSGVGVVSGTVVGFDVKRSGTSGYWLCTNTGHVYAYGGANYYGGLNGALTDIVGFASSHTDNGYYLLRDSGTVYTYGDAIHHGDASFLTLNDPMTDMAVHPDGIGYWLAAEDGGVFTYGNGMQFYGSLPGPWRNLTQINGNYFDLTDVVKDLVRWAGFWLYDGGVNPEPHGSYESTGIVSNDQDGRLPEDLFDKKPPIDAINQLKAIVGYNFSVDEEGAPQWGSPNWWQPGNFLPDGSHTDVIPEVNESTHLLSYGVNYSGGPMRSKILIASYQPEADVPGTVITEYTPSNAGALRGLHVPFMWVNGIFIKAEEQQLMAELIDLQINMQRRLGSVTMPAHPLLQVGDQIRIVERETSETYVHFIRSINSTHDLVTGEYLMNIATNWLGDEDDWAIYVPSAIARPATVLTTTTIATPGVAVPPPSPATVFTTTTIATTTSTGSVVEVSTVSLTTSIGAVTVFTGTSATASPSTVAVPVAIPTPTVFTGTSATAAPATVAVPTTIDAPTVTT